MKKISIVVPVYKVEKYLDKCVESIVNQTYKDLEIILVDDGSPDNCPNMCDGWAKKDNRIKVIHKENGGLSDARNFGIEASTGDYLMFVDSDDYLDVTICEKLVILLEKYNADFSMCKALKVYENKKIEECEEQLEIKVFKDLEVVDKLYNMDIEYLMTAWAKLYKKEIFKNIRYPKGKIHEDEFVIHEILNKTKCFVVTSEQMYFYLQRPTSIMGERGKISLLHTLEAYNARFEFLNKNYPNNTAKNTQWYMEVLRGLSVIKGDKFKDVNKIIIEEFRRVYNLNRNNSLKDFLFKNFRPIYKLLYKLKQK